MADEADTGRQVEQKEDPGAKSNDKKVSRGGFLQWIVVAVGVVLFGGAGFGLGRLFAGFGTTAAAESSERDQMGDLDVDGSAVGSQETWYYHLEPVVANLNEPNVTRYVRASLTLEISSQLNEKKGIALLDEKKPVLRNWLTIYLAGLTLEDIRGDSNLKTIQSQMLDAFNEELFPDSKPQIGHILFKEFAVQ